MYTLKVGIPIDFDYNPLSGGSYSYVQQLIRAIDIYKFNNKIEIVFLNFENKNISTLKPLISFHPFAKYTFKDLIRKGSIQLLKKLPSKILKKTLTQLEAKHAIIRNKNIVSRLNDNNIHILFYPNPDGNSFDFPFITIHWDIGHLSTYMFPEFLEDVEIRTNYYKNILPKALMVITETQTGKNELLNYTNINEERIDVMPIFPGEVINENLSLQEQKETLKILNLNSKKYFLYPAQFWAHKNHITLIDAFEIIHLKHPDLELVFTGSDKGNLSYIKIYISKKKLNKNIKILGFVSNAELFCLYKNTISLVMPTFLGPSNMPPLEAAFLGCPIIISDLQGHRELLGEYASYFSPLDSRELAGQMLNYLNIQDKEGIFQNADKFNIGQSLLQLEKTLNKTALIRKNWM